MLRIDKRKLQEELNAVNGVLVWDTIEDTEIPSKKRGRELSTDAAAGNSAESDMEDRIRKRSRQYI